jgi:hypothetical protein
MVGHFRPVRTKPAAIGLAALKVRRWSGMLTERVCATMQFRDRGIHHISLAGQTAVAAKPTCAAQVETGCSIASPLNKRLRKLLRLRSGPRPARLLDNATIIRISGYESNFAAGQLLMNATYVRIGSMLLKKSAA